MNEEERLALVIDRLSALSDVWRSSYLKLGTHIFSIPADTYIAHAIEVEDILDLARGTGEYDHDL